MIHEPVYIQRYPMCDGRCQYATNEDCKCQCQGRYHGFVYRGKRVNVTQVRNNNEPSNDIRIQILSERSEPEVARS